MSASMYYIAVAAPEKINNQVLKWKQYMKDTYGCEVALKSPAHITLIPPFWCQEELEKNIKESLQSFAFGGKTFPVSLNNFGCFKPRVIFVQIEESAHLSNLKTALEYFLLQRAMPVKKDSRPYHPHMTIANRDLLKKDFSKAWEFFQQQSYEAGFNVSGVSLLKHNGAQWDIIHTSFFPDS